MKKKCNEPQIVPDTISEKRDIGTTLMNEVIFAFLLLFIEKNVFFEGG